MNETEQAAVGAAEAKPTRAATNAAAEARPSFETIAERFAWSLNNGNDDEVDRASNEKWEAATAVYSDTKKDAYVFVFEDGSVLFDDYEKTVALTASWARYRIAQTQGKTLTDGKLQNIAAGSIKSSEF